MQAVVLLIGKKYLKLFNILNLKINNKEDMKGKISCLFILFNTKLLTNK